MRKRLGVLVLMLATGCVAFAQNPAPRIVDLKAADGTPLKASFFAAARPGPGVLLLHQINRDRKSWDPVAAQLAAAGFHTLTLDLAALGKAARPCRNSLTLSALSTGSAGLTMLTSHSSTWACSRASITT